MEIRKITDSFSVASVTLSVSDIPKLALAGFKTIICNRPDGEDDNQTPYQIIERASKQYGMACYFLPIFTGNMTDENINDMQKILLNAPAPMIAYCRSGTRCTNLWMRCQSY